MFHNPVAPPVVGVPECYYASPLVAGLTDRVDLSLRVLPADGLAAALETHACACALVSPAVLLHSSELSVLPGAGVVARETAPTERLLTALPLEAIRRIAVLPGAEHHETVVRVLFAERGITPPTFRPGVEGGEDARLVSGNAGLAVSRETPGFDLGSLWLETTGLPLVLGVWACTTTAPSRMLRHVLGESARQGEAYQAANNTDRPALCTIEQDALDHLYFRLLSLESDSVRALHTLALRHTSGETIAESIVFC